MSGTGSGTSVESAPTSQTAPPASQPTIVRNKVDDDWEKYTRDFIQRYHLDDDQTQAAWRVLHDCQERRTTYLRSRRERIAQLEGQLVAPKKVAEDGKKLLAELDDLKKPIQEIFEKQLKPRLDKLPTRAQRRAAEATSRPGDTKR